MRVLLVDDSPIIRCIQRRCLATLGEVEFAEAADGVEALTLLASQPPFDLIVIDWNMPNMDGITLVGKIRERDKRIPLIMCTADGEKRHVMAAVRAGVNNYIVKPFAPAGLLEKVQQTIEKARVVA